MTLEPVNPTPAEPLAVLPDDEVVRAFLALALPEDVRAALGRAQDDLRRAQAQVGWVAPANLHLTLVFLGDTFGATLRSLAPGLAAVAAASAPFALRVAGLGAFGRPRAPRVLWAGIPEPPPALGVLQSGAAAAARAAGIRLEDRPFAAHVTLGRVRSGRNLMALSERLRYNETLDFGTAAIGDVRLMRSRLLPGGPAYERLAAWRLEAAA